MDYYSFNRPRRDGWLSWPCWLTDSGRFTHKVVTRPAVSLAQDRKSSPARTSGLTTTLRHQLKIPLKSLQKCQIKYFSLLQTCCTSSYKCASHTVPGLDADPARGTTTLEVQDFYTIFQNPCLSPGLSGPGNLDILISGLSRVCTNPAKIHELA